MGTAFTFVSSDVVDKVGILRDFRKSSAKENYITIEKMIVYEKENNLINYEQAPSKSVRIISYFLSVVCICDLCAYFLIYSINLLSVS